MKVQPGHFTLRCLLLGACLLALVVPVRAMAQADAEDDGHPDAKSPFRKRMMGQVTAMAQQAAGRQGSDSAFTQLVTMNPLRSDNGANSTCGEDDNECNQKNVTTLGMNVNKSGRPFNAPLRAMRRWADAEALSNMYKEMITSQVSVLFQTMAMVENGAMAGFSQAMNQTSGVVSHITDATQLQLAMLDAVDNTGMEKRSYVSAIYNQSATDKQKDWSASALGALNDDPKAQPVALPAIQQTPYDFTAIRDVREAATGGPAASSTPTFILSKELFDKKKAEKGGAAPGNQDTGQPYSDDEIEEAEKAFVKRLGDMTEEYENDPKIPGGRKLVQKWLAPPDMANNGGPAGYEKAELKIFWDAWFEILKGYCQFKKENPNKDTSSGGNDAGKMFKKDTTATTSLIPKAQWKRLMAPDIPVSLSLVDQAFTLIQKQDHEKNLKCDELTVSKNKIPTKDDDITGEKLDDCTEGKGCMRNKLFFYLAQIVARSRTLHYYDHMYQISSRFADSPELQVKIDELFRNNFEGIDVDSQIDLNRTRYTEFLAFFGKLSQGQVGAGAFFRPNENSNTVNGVPNGKGG